MMGEEEEPEVFEDEEDEIFEDGLELAASKPKKHSGWIWPSIGAALLKNIFIDCAQAFAAVEHILDKRVLWEEERQKFSDSVKSDLLTIKTEDR